MAGDGDDRDSDSRGHLHRYRRRWSDAVHDPRVRHLRSSVTAVLFGDRTGQTLFLASLAFLALTWRVGTFFNDITLFVPALERLASGHLSLGTPADLQRNYPGMHYVDGKVYARNYGELALALPAYWVIDAIGATATRALVVVGWSALLVVLAGRAGEFAGRRRLALGVGAVIASVSLATNALAFGAFDEGRMNVAGNVTAAMALQVTTALAAAFTGVVLYRVLARRHGTRAGLLAGAVTVVASPVGLWATVPKRHALSAFFVVLALYALARVRAAERDGREGERDSLEGGSDSLEGEPDSRERGSDSLEGEPDSYERGLGSREGEHSPARVDSGDARLGAAGFRAIAYASAGLLAWIHAPEGFTLFLAVAIVDLPHALRSTRRARTLAVVGGALFLSLVPFLLTNYLISGDPLEPPRFLRSVGRLEDLPAPDPPAEGGTDGGGTDGSAGGDAGGDGSVPPDADWSADGASDSLFGIRPETVVPDRFLALIQIGVIRYVDGVQLLIDDVDRLSTVFVRWGERGRSPGSVYFDSGTDMSVLESLPVAAAVVAAPLAATVRAVRDRVPPREWGIDRVDAFAVVFSILLAAMFIDRLPLHVMITVRYLHPVYPLLIYAAVRQRPVRAALTRHTDYAVWGFEAAALLGTPLALGAILLDDGFFPPPPGDIVQSFALVALAAAAALGAALLASAFDERAERAAALAFGVAAGVTTAFVLVTAFFVFHFGEFALPAVEAAAEAYENAVFP